MSIKFRRLSEFLTENCYKADIENDKEYKCGGVRLNGRGVFVRETKLGSDIQKQWVMHKTKKNNVIYSTLFADKGAFAIAKECDEELVFSEKFVSFTITDNNVLPEYLHVVFQTDYLSAQCDELKTGMAAFSLSHSSKKKVLKLEIPIPDVKTQIKIIEEYSQYEKTRIDLEDEIVYLRNCAKVLVDRYANERLIGVKSIKLCDLGHYVIRSTSIIPGEMYKQITVKLHGNGVVLRKLEEGGNIKSKQFLVKTNDLIYSKIDVKSGAIGFIPQELDGGVVTSDFPTIEMNEISDIDKEFLMIFFSSDSFFDSMVDKSKGTTNRVRTKKSKFLEIEIPWGDEKFREEIVSEYKYLKHMIIDLAYQTNAIILDIPKMTSKYLNTLLGIN